MPTYEYECSACGHQFEILQSMQEDRLKKCPKCGKLKLNRLIGTGGGIIFRGSGFYETDYKRKTPPSNPSKDSSAKSEPKTVPTSSGGSHGCSPNCGCG